MSYYTLGDSGGGSAQVASFGGYRGLGIASAAVTTGSLCGGAKNVQAALNDLGFGPLAVDGQIGSGTQKAMKAFCVARGIPSKTWPDAAFCGALKAALVDKEAADAAAAAAAAAAAQGGGGGGGAIDPTVAQGGAVDPIAGGGVDPGPAMPGGLSTDTMIAIGVGVAAVLIVGAVMLSRGNMKKNADEAWPYGGCASCGI